MKSDLIALNKAFSLDNPKLMSKTQYALQREGVEITKNVAVANLHEQGRAFLTKTVLDNLGALSALESHLTQMNPSGEGRYRHIVDAYVFGAGEKILRW